jgi:riboflavin kinase
MPLVASAALRLSSSSSSSPANKDAPSESNSMDVDALTRLQFETSTTAAAAASVAATKEKVFQSATEHVQHQQVVFDELSTWFAHHGSHVPENLVAVYQHLASKIISSSLVVAVQNRATDDENEEKQTVVRILDVGTGTGVLYAFLLQAANENNVTLHITGVDLSPRMIELARENAQQALLQEEHQHHAIDPVQANVLEYHLPATTDKDKDETTSPCRLLYDAVIINACFGNFFDPRAVLQHLSSSALLSNSGSIFVTHPLGSAFVQQLHESDPLTVPHLLPNSVQEWQADYLLPGQVPLTIQKFCNANITIPNSRQDDETSIPFYYSHLARVRYTLSPSVLRFRGRVATGYGRGGKKLGFPTANLPSRLFQEALQNVTTGVYFGWALLEKDASSNGGGRGKSGRNVRHKAVVNVGYSPTFEGQENAEKIIEAHLMLDNDDPSSSAVLDPPDFYNETMRLELVAFLRREIKFPSFPALIAQIRADVDDSKVALQRHAPFVDWMTTKKNDIFWTDNGNNDSNPWIGTSGGDDAASWEFQDMRQYLLQNENPPLPPS